MAVDFATWPTKQEARMQLGGVPERTFDRWLSQHNVKIAYRKITGRRPAPVVDPAGIARIQREMMQPAPPATMLPATQHTAGVPAPVDIPPQWREMAAAFVAQVFPPSQPLFISLKEAIEYSGLTEGILRRLVSEGKVLGFPRIAGYKISRPSLDAFAQGTQNSHKRPARYSPP